MHSLSSEAIILERIFAEFVIYQNNVYFYVLNWFYIQQMKFPMLTSFT